MKKKFDFYDIRKTLREYPGAQYYLIYGERSSGKTYSALDLALEEFANDGKQFAYIRRYAEEVKRSEMLDLFSAHVKNGRLHHWFGNEWDDITFYSGKFYLVAHEQKTADGPISDKRMDKPIGYAFSISTAAHFKSVSYPNVKNIIFDEFMTRSSYLPDEFVQFTNLLSTIIRYRDEPVIMMLGNTVNRYCPYFVEMGLDKVKEQKPNTVQIYTYGDTKLRVVCEYTESAKNKGGKPSDIYFAFDNPRLQMITEGAWEISIYPRLPAKWRDRKNVIQDFFIQFDGGTLHGEIIAGESDMVLYFYPKYDPPEDDDITYGTTPKVGWNHMVSLTDQHDKLSLLIRKLISEHKAFYATNECGEIVRNYLLWSMKYSVTN